MNSWRGLALSLLVCGLAACGGGGGGSPAPAPPAPTPTGNPPPPATVNAAPTAANDSYGANRDVSLSVAAPGVLANDSDSNGDALTVRLDRNTAHGTVTLEPNGSFKYTPTAGFSGADEFTYAANDGKTDSVVAKVTITVGDGALFSDSFTRATSPIVGNGWVEVEATGTNAALVALDGTRLSFYDTSDVVMRPIARHGFNEVSSGYLEWKFEIDWAKTGTDDAYEVHMQLGNGAQMTAASATDGVGIDLVWGRIGGQDQTLGYRKAGTTTALMQPFTGHKSIRVRVDFTALAYDVYVDDQKVGSPIPLETAMTIDTMRFFSTGVNEIAFSGRSFDTISVEAGSSDGVTRNAAPVVPDQRVWSDDALAKDITLKYTDVDGPGPYTFDIVDGPQHGALGSDDGDATVSYTPAGGFIGTDSFTFRVSDGVANSGLATMQVVVQHYPGAAWETRTPDQAGLDATLLGNMAGTIGGVGTVIRDGYIVYTWGDQAARPDWASASKPILHTLLGFAVQEGKIASMDDRIGTWVSAATGGALRPEDEAITFAQLMNMASGYGVSEAPGAAWDYNDVASQLKNKLIGAILGEPLDAQLTTRLAPLQLQDGPVLTARNNYGASTTTRDFARIAWFWMNRGNWRNQELLSGKFFDDHMRSQVPGSTPRATAPENGPADDYLNAGTVGGGVNQTPYGPGLFGSSWWFNDMVGTTGLRAFPSAPLDAFQANGHWNREIVVMIPSMNLVVVTAGNWGSFAPGDAASGMNQLLRTLRLAVVR